MDPEVKTVRKKYEVDESKRKRFPSPMFKRTYVVDEVEVEKFLKRNGRLPSHVHAVAAESDNESES